MVTIAERGMADWQVPVTDFDYDVFLSYDSRDAAKVHPLAERLRADGLRVWLDTWMIPAGGDVFAEIEQGLQQSRVCVACMSAGNFASKWTQLERSTAMFRDPMNDARRFVPMLQMSVLRHPRYLKLSNSTNRLGLPKYLANTYNGECHVGPDCAPG